MHLKHSNSVVTTKTNLHYFSSFFEHYPSKKDFENPRSSRMTVDKSDLNRRIVYYVLQQ